MKLQSYLCVLLSIVLVTVAFSSVIGKQSQDRTTLSSTPLFSIRTNQALKQTTSITPSITYLCDNQEILIPINSIDDTTKMMKDMYILVDRIKNDPTFLEKIKKTYHELLIKHPSLLQNSLLKIADKQQLFNNTKSSPLYTKYETCALFCYVSIDRVDCLILLFLLILLALSYAIPMAIQRLIQLLGTVIKIIIDQIFPTLTVSNLTKLLKN